MTLLEEANSIYDQLKKTNLFNICPVYFSDPEQRQRKKAAREFIDTIYSRINANPKLLTCMLDTKPESKDDKNPAPLFLILQNWVLQHHSWCMNDDYYTNQFYRHLIGSQQLILKSANPFYDKNINDIIYLLKEHNLIFLDNVDVEQLIDGIQRNIPDHKKVLIALAKSILNQQFELASLGKPISDFRIQRFTAFITRMRAELIVMDYTEAVYTDDECSDSLRPKQNTTKAVSFFAALSNPAYAGFKIPTRDLIIAKIQDSKYDEPTLVKFKLKLFMHNIRAAIDSKSEVDILAALEQLKQIIANHNIDDKLTRRLLAEGFIAVNLIEISNKEAIIGAILSIIHLKADLTDTQQKALYQAIESEGYISEEQVYGTLLFSRTSTVEQTSLPAPSTASEAKPEEESPKSSKRKKLLG